MRGRLTPWAAAWRGSRLWGVPGAGGCSGSGRFPWRRGFPGWEECSCRGVLRLEGVSRTAGMPGLAGGVPLGRDARWGGACGGAAPAKHGCCARRMCLAGGGVPTGRVALMGEVPQLWRCRLGGCSGWGCVPSGYPALPATHIPAAQVCTSQGLFCRPSSLPWTAPPAPQKLS